MFVEYVNVTISVQTLDKLLDNNLIQDYTDDGFVYTNKDGWIPAGDVLASLINSEVNNEEKTKGQ